jgi:hypothetical protein
MELGIALEMLVGLVEQVSHDLGAFCGSRLIGRSRWTAWRGHARAAIAPGDAQRGEVRNETWEEVADPVSRRAASAAVAVSGIPGVCCRG